MHLSSPIPLPNPAAFEDQLLVKKKRGLDTPTPKKQCPSTPVRSPYMHHPHSTHHFNHPHPDSTHHLHLHQPRGLALCFDLASPFAPSSSSSSSIAPPSSTSASLHTPNVKDELKGNKGCFTELKRCSRSDQFITVSFFFLYTPAIYLWITLSPHHSFPHCYFYHTIPRLSETKTVLRYILFLLFIYFITIPIIYPCMKPFFTIKILAHFSFSFPLYLFLHTTIVLSLMISTIKENKKEAPERNK